MLTQKVRSAGNNCQTLHPSKINIYGAHALYEQSICLKWEKKFNSVKPGKCTVHSNSSSVRLWATWVQGQRVGVLVGTYICITYHHINAVTHIFDMWAGRGNLWSPNLLFLWPLSDIWHLHGSTDNCCELQNGPAWFLYWYQSFLQIPDWFIPLANP